MYILNIYKMSLLLSNVAVKIKSLKMNDYWEKTISAATISYNPIQNTAFLWKS